MPCMTVILTMVFQAGGCKAMLCCRLFSAASKSLQWLAAVICCSTPCVMLPAVTLPDQNLGSCCRLCNRRHVASDGAILVCQPTCLPTWQDLLGKSSCTQSVCCWRLRTMFPHKQLDTCVGC